MQDDEDERELREMFRILDKEKRGEVNTNELRLVACQSALIKTKICDFQSLPSGQEYEACRKLDLAAIPNVKDARPCVSPWLDLTQAYAFLKQLLLQLKSA